MKLRIIPTDPVNFDDAAVVGRPKSDNVAFVAVGDPFGIASGAIIQAIQSIARTSRSAKILPTIGAFSRQLLGGVIEIPRVGGMPHCDERRPAQGIRTS